MSAGLGPAGGGCRHGCWERDREKNRWGELSPGKGEQKRCFSERL